MPWSLILYGVVLPVSLGGLLLTVYANFRMQRLHAHTFALREAAKTEALDALEAMPQWRGYQRLMWTGVVLVIAPALLLLALLVLRAGGRFHASTISPVIVLPLMLTFLPVIASNNRRRTQLMQKAGIDTSLAFSVDKTRKLEALKQTPEWRRLSRQALMVSGVIFLAACVFAALTFATISGGANGIWG
jgi:hypothetical protein